MDYLSPLKEYGKDFLDTLEYNNKLNDFFVQARQAVCGYSIYQDVEPTVRNPLYFDRVYDEVRKKTID